MPVDSYHPQYCNHQAEVCEHAYEGKVKQYVPKPTGMSTKEYEQYVSRGVYFNMTKRTVEASVGAITRRNPSTNVEDIQIVDDLSVNEFCSQIARELFLSGRAGVLVDYDMDKEAPYLCYVERENIINWRSDYSMIMLKEHVLEENPKDPYELVYVCQYRKLFINEQGFYEYTVYRKDGQDNFYVYDSNIPTYRGTPFTEVPFVFVNPFDITQDAHEPIILNMAQINISHFISTVDIEHAVHFTALPQPYVAGDFARDVEGDIPIGSFDVWMLEANAKPGYLEFSGSGLSSIERRMTDKQEQMAAIGSRLLIPKNGVESADALRMRSAAESATLANVTGAIESAMQTALAYYMAWLGQPNYSVEFHMSRDFNASVLGPNEMKSLMDLYMNGTISQETFLDNLYRGEITPETQEELERLTMEKTGTSDVVDTTTEETGEESTN